MKVALPVIRLGKTQEDNLNSVIDAIDLACSTTCDLVLFAETTISGLIPNDNASEMLRIGQEIPGEITDRISSTCKSNNVWVSIGLLEREGTRLFDTAVIIGPSGEIELKYRRISPQWHWPKSDPDVFCQGNNVEYTDTPFGRIATLICGDFFDNQRVIRQTKDVNPDFVHLLLVRNGTSGKEYTQEKWEEEELPEYASQVRILGIPVLMVNYIYGECFGGATIFAGDGSVAASLPLWKEGILEYDLGPSNKSFHANAHSSRR
jgi:predicted amidohydrolase